MSTPFKMKGYSYSGASPLRSGDTPYETVKDAGNTLTKTGQGTDVTPEYTKKGNKSTREHIASGGTVLRMPDGSLRLQMPT